MSSFGYGISSWVSYYLPISYYQALGLRQRCGKSVCLTSLNNWVFCSPNFYYSLMDHFQISLILSFREIRVKWCVHFLWWPFDKHIVTRLDTGDHVDPSLSPLLLTCVPWCLLDIMHFSQKTSTQVLPLSQFLSIGRLPNIGKTSLIRNLITVCSLWYFAGWLLHMY